MPEFTAEELSEAHSALLSVLYKCERIDAGNLVSHSNPSRTENRRSESCTEIEKEQDRNIKSNYWAKTNNKQGTLKIIQ